GNQEADGSAARRHGQVHAGARRGDAQEPAAGATAARSQHAHAQPAGPQEYDGPAGEHGAARQQGRGATIARAAAADDGKSADGAAGPDGQRRRRHDVAARRAWRHDPQAAAVARSHLPPGTGYAPRPPARTTWAEQRPADGRAAPGSAGTARAPEEDARGAAQARRRRSAARREGRRPGRYRSAARRCRRRHGPRRRPAGDSNTDGAVDSQGKALESLRKGAQGMAQQLQQQQGVGLGPGQPGRNGQARADSDTDPLGRPRRGHNYDDSTVKIPGRGEAPAERASRILEELRRRYSDQGRPQLELDYLERLL